MCHLSFYDQFLKPSTSWELMNKVSKTSMIEKFETLKTTIWDYKKFTEDRNWENWIHNQINKRRTQENIHMPMKVTISNGAVNFFSGKIQTFNSRIRPGRWLNWWLTTLPYLIPWRELSVIRIGTKTLRNHFSLAVNLYSSLASVVLNDT